jgi:hypothetical protein
MLLLIYTALCVMATSGVHHLMTNLKDLHFARQVRKHTCDEEGCVLKHTFGALVAAEPKIRLDTVVVALLIAVTLVGVAVVASQLGAR